MLHRDDIRHVHWQLRSGEDAPASGAIVTGYADIHQEIRTIILTPVGSVPTSPLKGCDILPYIDWPPSEAIPRLVRSIWDAVATWVSRVEVLSVSAAALDVAHFRIEVPWRVRDGVARDIEVTRLALGRRGLSPEVLVDAP